jgi:hypothetical protein
MPAAEHPGQQKASALAQLALSEGSVFERNNLNLKIR